MSETINSNQELIPRKIHLDAGIKLELTDNEIKEGGSLTNNIR